MPYSWNKRRFGWIMLGIVAAALAVLLAARLVPSSVYGLLDPGILALLVVGPVVLVLNLSQLKTDVSALMAGNRSRGPTSTARSPGSRPRLVRICRIGLWAAMLILLAVLVPLLLGWFESDQTFAWKLALGAWVTMVCSSVVLLVYGL